MSKPKKVQDTQSIQPVPRLLYQKDDKEKQPQVKEQKILCFNSDFEQCDKTDGQSNDKSGQSNSFLSSQSIASYQEQQIPYNSKLLSYQKSVLQCLNESEYLKNILKQDEKFKNRIQKAIKMHLQNCKFELFECKTISSTRNKKKASVKKEFAQKNEPLMTQRRRRQQKFNQSDQITQYIKKKPIVKENPPKRQRSKRTISVKKKNKKSKQKSTEKSLQKSAEKSKQSERKIEKSESCKEQKKEIEEEQNIDVPDLKISRKNNLTEIHLNLSEFLSKKGLEDYELNVTFHKQLLKKQINLSTYINNEDLLAHKYFFTQIYILISNIQLTYLCIYRRIHAYN